MNVSEVPLMGLIVMPALSAPVTAAANDVVVTLFNPSAVVCVVAMEAMVMRSLAVLLEPT